MFLLSKHKKIGKIYQVGDISTFLLNNPHILVLCTFKRVAHPHSQICCTVEDLILELKRNERDILIYSMSTFSFTDKLYKYLQIFNCKGSDVFVHTFTKSKLWYADQRIN